MMAGVVQRQWQRANPESLSRYMYPLEGLLLNLDQKIPEGRREYLDQHEAYKQLKAITGQDFGYDSQKWRDWIVRHQAELRAQNKPSR